MSNLGSSPRMRGSLILTSEVADRTGIIPAHAGLTPDRRYHVSRSRDHPRACGAHIAVVLLIDGLAGSSPRMRGSQRRYKIRWIIHGIIPAHAGLTQDHEP